MIVIGLHGRIGAGKSTVAGCFRRLGAHVIDADRIAHEVLEEPAVRSALAARFGPRVIGPDGRVARAAVGELVFGSTPAHASALGHLEAIVHPRVHAEISARLEALRSRQADDEVVVLDVPLLARAGWIGTCDHVVEVTCDEEERRRRLSARGVSPDQQAAREAAWHRGLGAGFGGEKPHGRTFTVDTSGDPSYTLGQVENIWLAIGGRAGGTDRHAPPT